MADIFISYKREDLILSKALAIRLTALGWSVWWDHEIPAGQDYDKVIEDELTSAKCVLVLWSDRSVNSRNVKDEANVALDRSVLIPILIGKDTRPPLGFRMIQGVRWNDNDHVEDAELEELLKHIKRLLGEPPIERKKPEKPDVIDIKKEPIPPPEPEPGKDKHVPEPPQKNRFCTNCGKMIKPAQLFCTGCGKKAN